MAHFSADKHLCSSMQVCCCRVYVYPEAESSLTKAMTCNLSIMSAFLCTQSLGVVVHIPWPQQFSHWTHALQEDYLDPFRPIAAKWLKCKKDEVSCQLVSFPHKQPWTITTAITDLSNHMCNMRKWVCRYSHQTSSYVLHLLNSTLMAPLFGQVTPEQRSQTKRLTYAVLYGLGPYALSQQLNTDPLTYVFQVLLCSLQCHRSHYSILDASNSKVHHHSQSPNCELIKDSTIPIWWLKRFQGHCTGNVPSCIAELHNTWLSTLYSTLYMQGIQAHRWFHKIHARAECVDEQVRLKAAPFFCHCSTWVCIPEAYALQENSLTSRHAIIEQAHSFHNHGLFLTSCITILSLH